VLAVLLQVKNSRADRNKRNKSASAASRRRREEEEEAALQCEEVVSPYSFSKLWMHSLCIEHRVMLCTS
jgi:hypothetical protein